MVTIRRVLAVGLATCLVALAAPLAVAAEPQAKKGSGLPVPRFASMRSDLANVRAGPGSRYPIEWVFQKKAMPVEIVAEFDNYRKIRDFQGASGWVHQSLLQGRRTFVVVSEHAVLRRTPAPAADGVAKLEREVMGEIRSCAGDWCRVKVDSMSGWLERKDLWGVYRGEPVN